MINLDSIRQHDLFAARDIRDKRMVSDGFRFVALKPIRKWLFLCVLIAGFSISAVDADDSVGKATALREIFGESVPANNVRAIRLRAAAMPLTERFEFLMSVIFPVSNGGAIATRGEFASADLALLDSTLPQTDVTEHSALVSPVYDLLDAAKKLGRLQQVRDRIDSLPQTADEYRNKAISSLRLLVNLEQGDQPSAERAADDVLLASEKSRVTTVDDLWPEMLALYRAVNHHHADNLVADLLPSISVRGAQAGGATSRELWQAHLLALEQQTSSRAAGNKPDSRKDLLLNGHPEAVWQPAGRRVSRTRGTGFPEALWASRGRELQHISGHDMDFLMYRSPLRGNYEVEADLYLPAVTQLAVAGRVVGMSAAGQGIILGTFGNGTTVTAIQPHWGTGNPWIRYRAVVRDGLLTVSIDGRTVHSEPLSEHHDPWIGFHSGALSSARVRDIRITGHPEVPDKVTLSGLADLRGWVSYHEEPIGGEDGVWRWIADPDSTGQIVATADDSLRDTLAESLLSYQRPLLEDGSVSYEFFYDSKTAAAHPALDRRAFLIQPTEVALHQVTDGRYDVTNLSPDNTFEATPVLPVGQRIPLRSGDWNQIKLAVQGDTVTLELNGVRICEQRLEAVNRCTFGLFRYADSAIRVRNVVLQGEWPKTVPPVSEQAYADPLITAIDARLPQLKARFSHDFAMDGLPDRYFRRPSGKPEPEATPNGVIHTEVSHDDTWAYSVIQPVVEMHGDFDVVLRFDDLEMSDLYSAAGLGLFIGDKHLELIRRHGEPLVERVHATYVTPTPDGQGRSVGHELTTEALEGTFRIVRRGDVITTLFADHDSTVFRMIAERTWDNCRMTPATLDIRTIAYNQGRAQVTWKKLEVAAERLMRLPGLSEQPKPVVFAINADGTNLKQLTQPSPKFVWHGSPEWSPDGQRIAFDAWTGSANSSRIFIMNSDGSDVKDLGPGIIPTFSPDGKRIAFTWSGHGTTLMNADGTDRKVLSTDGWGCQWSPNGRWIVFGSQNRTPDGDFGANLTLIDVNTKETRLLLTGKQATAFQQIMWNMAWSPDGGRIVFYGNRSAGPGVALVSVDGSEAEFKILAADGVSANFSWNPDGRHILMSRAGLLHEYDIESDKLAPIPGHSADPAKDGAVWDTTGQRITFIGVPKPQSVDWE